MRILVEMLELEVVLLEILLVQLQTEQQILEVVLEVKEQHLIKHLVQEEKELLF